MIALALIVGTFALGVWFAVREEAPGGWEAVGGLVLAAELLAVVAGLHGLPAMAVVVIGEAVLVFVFATAAQFARWAVNRETRRSR